MSKPLLVMAWASAVVSVIHIFVLQLSRHLTCSRNGFFVRAVANVVGSVILCICAVALGHAVAAHFNGKAPEIAQISAEEEATLSQKRHRLS